MDLYESFQANAKHHPEIFLEDAHNYVVWPKNVSDSDEFNDALKEKRKNLLRPIIQLEKLKTTPHRNHYTNEYNKITQEIDKTKGELQQFYETQFEILGIPSLSMQAAGMVDADINATQHFKNTLALFYTPVPTASTQLLSSHTYPHSTTSLSI